MADIHAPLKPPTTAGLAPTPPVSYTAWNEALGYAAGLSTKRLMVQYRTGAPNANTQLSDDGRDLINVPLRQALITSTGALSNVSAVTGFGKNLLLLANEANVVGAQIEISAGGRISTRASAPGTAGFGINLGGAQIFVGSMVQGTLLPSAVNWGWSAVVRCTVRTTGSTGTVSPGYGVWYLPTTLGVISVPAASVTIDLTVDRGIEAFWDWEIADPANAVIQDHFDYRVTLTGRTAT
jgi:hypothetical protein